LSLFWKLCDQSQAAQRAFSSLAVTCQCEGEEINDNWMSRLTRCEVKGRTYYVKEYKTRGKNLRRLLGRSRVRAEWENVQLLSHLGIPTLRLVAYGEVNGYFGRYSGAMVTEEIPDVRDLAEMVEKKEWNIQGKPWIDEVMGKLSMLVRLMHQKKFVHNDLKWRNILVSSGDKVEVYIIDCPAGRQLNSAFLLPFFERGVIKDLACLDKVGQHALTRTRRLRFYLRYAGQNKLDLEHKIRIGKILTFFKGRE